MRALAKVLGIVLMAIPLSIAGLVLLEILAESGRGRAFAVIIVIAAVMLTLGEYLVTKD